ncbi:integrase [Croceicoccus sp. Ery15]|uniref:integrase n=1 Tax=Croceicoccus sp. Ery15 TaxID=1703338 RepID=UPI001E4AD91E|nr:integrase [Croceicoccus sp. Ery15]
MPRHDSPLVVGDYWLDKRRDGKSPDIWQIATYAEKSRSIVYRSTKRRTVEEAEPVLRAYEAAERTRSRDQTASELIPHLFHYLREHGPDVKRIDTVKSSFRAWIGFFQQDDLGTGVAVSDLTKSTVARFRRWRMGPHRYSVEWNGKTFNHISQGVTGESVQRNIEDMRAALHHAEAEGRIVAPKIASVDRKLRSDARDVVLTARQLGAMIGYAKDDKAAYRWLALMIATASRPGPALAFDPETQWHDDVLDLHPTGEARTDKQNAVVPVIAPLKTILKDWQDNPHEAVKSRKRWWHTMRGALGLPEEVTPYTIRHTVATFMDQEGVPGAELSSIAGHLPSHRGVARTTSRHYLHYDPHHCPKARKALTKLFRSVEAEAAKWSAGHSRATTTKGKVIILASEA